jgi:hypothetical protein
MPCSPWTQHIAYQSHVTEPLAVASGLRMNSAELSALSYGTARYRERFCTAPSFISRIVYLDEFEFRFVNRHNPFLFRDRLLRLLASSNLEYKTLTKNVS